jgi:uncharacterized protein DUF4177
MQKWEYKAFCAEEEGLRKLLNDHGQEGWELVSAVQQEDTASEKRRYNFMLFFKRPASEAFHGAT